MAKKGSGRKGAGGPKQKSKGKGDRKGQARSRTGPAKRSKKKSSPAAKGKAAEPTLKQLAKALEKAERENRRLADDIRELRLVTGEQGRVIRSLEGRMETRVKREEVVMKALNFSSRTKKGENGVIGELNRSILKTEEYLLHMGKRIDNILSAIKNHREYLIRLNRKVYRADAKKFIEIEIEIINNTLSIMALSGFDINKSIFTDTKRIKKMIAKEDVDLAKVRKSMERLESKFDDEMERFDYESIFKESHDIPGYR
jgi:hypothetical protein